MHAIDPLTLSLPRLLLIGVLGAGGCITPKGDLGEFTDSDATGDPGGSTGTASSTGDDTTTASTDASTTAGTGDPPACADPDMTESFTLEFDPPLQGTDFSGDCLVSDGDGSHILQCGAQQVELAMVLGHQPTPLFQAGDTVALRYLSVQSFDISEWFTIRRPDDQSLLLGGVNANQLVPPGGTLLFDPVALDHVDGVCSPPTGCDHPYEHVAVKAENEQQFVEVMPGAFAQVGDTTPIDLSVGVANKYTSQFSDGMGGFCEVSDLPPYRFQVLLRRVPE